MQVHQAEVREIAMAALLASGRELFKVNHHETMHVLGAKHNPPLVIDDNLLLAMERCGVMLTLGLFEEEQLVGYAVATVFNRLFTGERTCSVLVVFVHPDHRRSNNARRLMDEVERLAFERGQAKCVEWHCLNPGFEALLQQRGARLLETIYVVRK